MIYACMFLYFLANFANGVAYPMGCVFVCP